MREEKGGESVRVCERERERERERKKERGRKRERERERETKFSLVGDNFVYVSV